MSILCSIIIKMKSCEGKNGSRCHRDVRHFYVIFLIDKLLRFNVVEGSLTQFDVKAQRIHVLVNV